MVITAIEQQKKNQKRYSIFIDGSYAFSMSDVDVLFYKLKENEELPQQRYDYLMDHVVFTKAKEKAFHYLGYQSRTKREVEQKLLEEYDPSITQRVISLLEQYGYLDDRQYVRSFIKEKLHLKKDGKIKIMYALKQKGISDTIINECFLEQPIDETLTIVVLIEKRLKNRPIIDVKEKNRLIQYLIRKGFSYEHIFDAIEQYGSE